MNTSLLSRSPLSRPDPFLFSSVRRQRAIKTVVAIVALTIGALPSRAAIDIAWGAAPTVPGDITFGLAGGGNWAEGSVPGFGLTTNIAFGLSTLTNINVPASAAVGSITFYLTDPVRPSYTFTGVGSPTLTIGGNVTVNNGGNVTFDSGINVLLSAGSRTATVNGATLTVAGIVGETGGVANVVKDGGGTLVLSGANTFTGTTTISNGYLSISADNNLGAAPASATADFLTIAGALAVTNDVMLKSNRGVTLVGGASFNIDSGKTLTYGGIVAGTGALNINPTGGTLVLSGTNTYSGLTTIYGGKLTVSVNASGLGTTAAGTVVTGGGTLELSGVALGAEPISLVGALLGTGTSSASGPITLSASPAAPTIGGAGALTLSGTIDGGGALAKVDAGTLILSHANTYTGGTSLSSGILRVTDIGALGTGPLTTGGGTLQFASNASVAFTGTNTTVGGNTTFTADRFGPLASSTSVTHSLGTLGIGGQTLTVNRGSLINGTGIGGLSFSSTTLTGNAIFNVDTSALLTLGVIGQTGGPWGISKSGSGTLILDNLNTYAGTTKLFAGTLRVTNAGGLGTGTLTANTGTLQLASNAAATFTGTNTTIGGGVTFVADRISTSLGNTAAPTLTLGTLSIGSQTLTISRGTTSGITGTGALIFGATSLGGNATFNVNSNAALTLGAIGQSDGTAGLTKSGSGTLTFAGSNTYTGNTTVSAGTLDLGNQTQTVVGTVTISGGVIQNGTLTGAPYAGQSGAVNAKLSGSGALTKTTSGTLTIGAVNDYTGGTNVSAGTLRVTTADGLGTGALAVSGGTLQFASDGPTLFHGTNTTITGNATFSADRINSNSSNVTHTLGTLAIDTHTLTVSGGGQISGFGIGGLIFGATTLNGSATFNVGSDAALTLGAITQNGGNWGLTKSGTGVLTLPGDNSAFAGSLTASAGGVTLTNAGARGTGPWTFNSTSVLNANVADALSGLSTIATVFNTGAQLTVGASGAITGGTQTFTGSSDLIATQASSITGGVQNFSGTATLTASGSSVGIVNGGAQTFDGSSTFNANVSNAIIGGTQDFVTSAKLVAAQSHAVNGGAQSFTNTTELDANHSGAVDGGTQTFHSTSSLQIGASGTIINGEGGPETVGVISSGHQLFYDTSLLKVHPTNSLAISGGAQDFYDGAALAASGPNSIVGGTQTFTGSPALPSNFMALDDATFGEFLKTTARLTVTKDAGASITGGTQYFHGTASLQINTSNGLAGTGTQYFDGDSHLRASRSNSIVGGTQNFSGSSFLWAKGADSSAGVSPTPTNLVTNGTQNFSGTSALWAATTLAVSGGSQTFYDNSSLYANAFQAVKDVTLNLYDESAVRVGADDALTGTTNLIFNGSSNHEHTNEGPPGGYFIQMLTESSGGQLLLNSSHTTVGFLHSAVSGAGRINLGNEALTTNTDVDTTFSGQIVGDATGSLIKAGEGTLTLTGTNVYAKTVINGGALAIGATNTLQAGSTESPGFGHDVEINAGTLAVNYDQTIRALSGLGGTASIANAHTFTVNLPNSGDGSTSTFSGSLDGSGSFVKTGPGSLILAGASPEFTGSTAVTSGTLTVASASGLGATSAGTTVSTGATLNIDNVTVGNEPVSLSGFGAAGAGAISGTGANAALTGPITLTGLGGPGNPGNAIGGTGTLTLSGAIGQSTSGLTLTKVGTGTLVLNQASGANTYTGGTFITNGTLRIGQTNTLSTNTALNFSSTGSAKLDVVESQAIQRLGLSGTASQIDIALNKIFSVTLGGDSMGTTFNGIISGNGSFKVGASDTGQSVTLLNANTYTGNTVIESNGILRLGTNGSLSGSISDSSHVTNNGILLFNRNSDSELHYNADMTMGSNITGAGSVVKSGNATITLSGENSYSGGTTINAGALIAGSTSAFGSGPITINGGVFGTAAGVTINNTLNLASGGLVGAGFFNNATIGANGSVGAEVGGLNTIATLTFNELTLAGGGTYVWNLANPNGAAGVGYDLITISSPHTLTIDSTSGSPFIIRPVTLSSSGVTGSAGGFLNQNYSWTLIAAQNNLTASFAPNKFQLDTSAFATNLGGGMLSLGLDGAGTSLMLNFTPVPEPSTWVLMLMGAGAFALGARRRLRRR